MFGHQTQRLDGQISLLILTFLNGCGHVGFVLPEKHCPAVFFAGLLFVFDCSVLKKQIQCTENQRPPVVEQADTSI